MQRIGLITVEEYLRTKYEPDAEFVDGVIEERAAGGCVHSSWQAALCGWFCEHGGDWNLRALPVLRIRVSRTRFRVPDVTVLDSHRLGEQIPTHPPAAVFEVLAPEDRMVQMLTKLADYEAMGIGTILVIDPEAPRFYQYIRGSLQVSDAGSIEIAGTRAQIEWASVTSEAVSKG